MDVREPEFKAYIEPHEFDDIRAAIKAWGKPDTVVETFYGARLAIFSVSGNYFWRQTG